MAEDSATVAKEALSVATLRAEMEATASSYSSEENQKSIKFKDAVGRNFSFPFYLCKTWNVSLRQSSNPQISTLKWSVNSPP